MPKVTIYTTPTCAFCHAAKQYMDSIGVKYEAIDVTTVPGGAQMLLDKSGQLGVPVIDVEGDIIVGFNRGALAEALRKHKLL